MNLPGPRRSEAWVRFVVYGLMILSVLILVGDMAAQACHRSSVRVPSDSP